MRHCAPAHWSPVAMSASGLCLVTSASRAATATTAALLTLAVLSQLACTAMGDVKAGMLSQALWP
jgi:hypothetical protein